ncbi:MAG: hypothetical protein ACJ786_36010 [Catenulispora sp.]|jgi:hypothetical protein
MTHLQRYRILKRMPKAHLFSLAEGLGIHIEQGVPGPTKEDLVQLILAREHATRTEEQPAPAAPAGATVDVTKPYCWQIDRTDTEPARMLSWGGLSTAPMDDMTVQAAAEYEVANARIAHGYFGPLTLRMWSKRDNERYRMEPPQGCYRLDMPDMDASKDLLDAVDRLHETEQLAQDLLTRRSEGQ